MDVAHLKEGECNRFIVWEDILDPPAAYAGVQVKSFFLRATDVFLHVVPLTAAVLLPAM